MTQEAEKGPLSESEVKRRECQAREMMGSLKTQSYELGNLLWNTKTRTEHGRFQRFIKEALIGPRTATNLISYAKVIYHAKAIDGREKRKSNGNAELFKVREEVEKLPHTVVYQLGSRNLSYLSRDKILCKIGMRKYASPDEVIADIVALNGNRSRIDCRSKKPSVGNLTSGEAFVEDDLVVIPFTSDGHPCEWRMKPSEIYKLISTLGVLAGQAASMKLPTAA